MRRSVLRMTRHNVNPGIFREHLCGYDLNLTYPQHGHFPTLVDPFSDHGFEPELGASLSRIARRASLKRALMAEGKSKRSLPNQREVARREEQRQEWKRSIAGRPNGTLDPYYGCFLFDELWEYAANYSIPWVQVGGLAAVDVYDVPDALNPEIPIDPSIFLNGKYRRGFRRLRDVDLFVNFRCKDQGSATCTDLQELDSILFLSI